MQKDCTRCGERRDLTEFRRDRSKRDGRHTICKLCKKHTDQEQKLLRRYGITLDDWQRMYEAQGGTCWICKRKPKHRLQVDHCHTTLKVRGLLCGACNKALGLLRDDPNRMSRAAIYVAIHQGETE